MKDLTGKYYFKKRLLGGFTLIVEHKVNNGCPWDYGYIKKYSKGNQNDLNNLKLRK